MKISYLLNESEKIVLYTDERYFGADVPDEYIQRPSAPVPVDKLYGYEPDDKMNDIHSANAVIDLAVKMRQGDSIPPIVVRKTAQGYQVLDGHHRMHAARKAGLDTLDAVVVDAGDIVYSDEVKTEGKFAKAAGAAALAGACVAGTPGCATMDTKDALRTVQTVGRVAQQMKNPDKVRAGAEEELYGILRDKLRNIKDGKYDESIYTDLKKKFGPIVFKADYDKAAEYLHKELVKISRGQRELPHGLGYYAQQIAKELQGIDYRTLIDVYKDQYGMEGLTEADKMGAIDVGSSIQNAQEEWRTWIQSLPTQLAQEFIDERPNPDQEDIDVFTKLRLTSKTPIKVSTKALLNEPWMKGSISRTPQPVVDAINKRWGTNFKSGTVYDRDPDRFFRYAKMTANTAKPSVMVDGDVIFGVGRMIAALLRGDDSVPVWNLKTVTTEGASGYIPSAKEKNDPRFKTALTVDVKPGETQRQAKKLGMTIDKKGNPPLLHKTAAKNTSANKAYNLGLTESKLQTMHNKVISAVNSTGLPYEEIWMHGSRTTGTARRTSDYDYLVVVPAGAEYIDYALTLPKLKPFPKADIQPAKRNSQIFAIAQEEGFKIADGNKNTSPNKAYNLGLTEAREIEFVCVNPDFCDATEQKNQDALFQALKQIPGIIVYKQDFDIHNSMAAVLKSSADRNTVADIKRLAKQHNVGIDLEQQVSDKRVDAIYTGDLQGLVDWYDTDNLNESSAIKESVSSVPAYLYKWVKMPQFQKYIDAKKLPVKRGYAHYIDQEQDFVKGNSFTDQAHINKWTGDTLIRIPTSSINNKIYPVAGDRTHYKTLGMLGKFDPSAWKYESEEIDEYWVAGPVDLANAEIVKGKNPIEESLWAKYKALKESTLEEEDLVEISQTPGAIRDWANSEAADGIIAGFEAEVVLPDVGGLEYDEDRESDMSEDRRPRSIDDVIEFFEFDDHGYGLGRTEADDLRSTLREAYNEWLDESIMNMWDYDEFKGIMEDEGWLDDIVSDEIDAFDEDDIAQEIFSKDYDELDDDDQSDVKSSIADRANEEAEKTLMKMWDGESGFYGDALEAFREQKYDDRDLDEDEFFDQNYPFMSDISDTFDIYWPYIERFAQDAGAWEDFGEQMQETLGKKVVVSTYYHGETRGDYYIIEPDSSISPDSSSDAGAEIVSPPMPLSQAHQQLQDLAQFLKSNGAYTNSSTGLHMGISLPDYGRDVDYVKLVMFTGDQYMLNTFGRAYNSYARSAMEKLQVRMRDAQDAKNRGGSGNIDIVAVMNNLRKGLATIASELVRGKIGDEKFTSIHIKTEADYIEFRIAGGDYLNQIDDAELAMLRFARAYTIAADQDAERGEYLKKLYKLVDSGSPTENLWAQYQSGEIDAEQLKDKWANRVLGIDPEASGQDAFGDRTFSIRKKSTGQIVKDVYARDEEEAESVFQNYLKQFDGNKETEADYELVDPSKPNKEPTGRKGEVAKRLQGRERIFRFVLLKPQDWEKEKAGVQESIMQAVLREAPETVTFNVPATSLEQAREKLPYYADWISAKTASRAEAKVVSKKDYTASPEPDYTPKEFGFAFTISEYGVDGDVQALLIKAPNRATAIDLLRDQIRDMIGSHARVTNLRDVKPGDVEKIKKNKAFGDEKTYSMIVKIRCENGDIEYKRLDIKAPSADSAKKKAEAALKPNYPRCAVMPYLEGEKTQYKASGNIYFTDDNGQNIPVPTVQGETINIPLMFDLEGPKDSEAAYAHAMKLLQRKYPAKPDDPGKRNYNISYATAV